MIAISITEESQNYKPIETERGLDFQLVDFLTYALLLFRPLVIPLLY